MYDLYSIFTVDKYQSQKNNIVRYKGHWYFAMAIPMAKSSITFVVTVDIKLSHCLILYYYILSITDAHKTELTGKSVKGKRHRTAFTTEQLQTLETEFENQQYLVGNER